MDPDEAGRKVVPGIFSSLNPIMEKVVNIELNEKTDPAESAPSTVLWVKQYLESL